MVLLPELIVNKQNKTIPLFQETVTKNSPHTQDRPYERKLSLKYVTKNYHKIIKNMLIKVVSVENDPMSFKALQNISGPLVSTN